MDTFNLAQRVKELRNRKGISQENLAEASGLSLRTIQRIENNETAPRGDTLKRLAIALDTTPDDIVDWKIQEDKSFLTLMCLSALGFLFFPILGIIIPLVFWILKKDKIRNVNEVGKAILNFEMTWCIVFFSYFIFIWLEGLAVILKLFNVVNVATIFKLYLPLIILYGYHIIIIAINAILISKGKKTKFIPSFRILR